MSAVASGDHPDREKVELTQDEWRTIYSLEALWEAQKKRRSGSKK